MRRLAAIAPFAPRAPRGPLGNWPTARSLALAALGLAALAASGCSAIVGDACETSTDCGTSMYCETSLPSGYCTRRSYVNDGCPSVGGCVTFSPTVSRVASCASDSDCRDGYRCVTDFGPHAYCGDARGDTPGQ